MSEQNRPPAFQFYPEKWLAHTMHLSASAYRIFHRMLCWMWLHGDRQCRMPKDPQAISEALAIPRKRVEKALDEIQSKHTKLLKIDGDVFISGGLQKESEKQFAKRRQSVIAAKTRWRKDLEKSEDMRQQCGRNADAMHEQSGPAMRTQCPPTPTPIPAPTPTPKDKNKSSRHESRDTWLTPFDEIWREQYGGPLPMGQAAKALAPLVKEHGDLEVMTRWQNYTVETEGRYAGPQSFASRFGEWSIPKVLERRRERDKKRRMAQGRRHP